MPSTTYNELLKIYVDMDGVIADMVPYAFEWYGFTGYDDTMWPDHVGYDIVEAYRILTSDRDMEDSEFWQGLSHQFWATVPKTSFCDPLISYLLSNYKNVFISTNCTEDPFSAAGKLEWIQDNLPECLHRNYIITPNKYCHARSDSLLIDDCDSHVDKFEEAGGFAITVPRPWNLNKGNHLKPFDYILKALEYF